MTVKQLKRLIRSFPEDWDVLVAADPECNDWRHLGHVLNEDGSMSYDPDGFQYVRVHVDDRGKPCALLVPGYPT